MIRKLDKSALWKLLIIAIIISLRLWINATYYQRPELVMENNDSISYLNFANAINEGGPFGPEGKAGDLHRTPGYPLFLLGVIQIPGDLNGNLAIAQTLLSSLTGIFLYLLLKHLITKTAAFFGLLIYLLDPLSLFWAGKMLTETLFTFVITALVYIGFLWYLKRKAYLLIFMGIFLAIASYVRPIGLLILPALLFFVFVLILGEDRSTWKGKIGKITLGLAIVFFSYFLLVKPWSIRNKNVWNCDSFSIISMVNLRTWMAAKVFAEVQQISVDEADKIISLGDDPTCPTHSDRYLKIILDHPQVYAKLHLAGLMPIFLGTNFDGYLQLFGSEFELPDLWQPYLDDGFGAVLKIMFNVLKERPIAILLFGFLLSFQMAILITSAIGFYRAVKYSTFDQRILFIFMGMIMFMLIISPGPAGQERFRVPIQPLLIFFSFYKLKKNN